MKKGLPNNNHIALKLIMKHEDEFNAIEPNHEKLRAIEQKVDNLGSFSTVARLLRQRCYASAIKFVANTYMIDWNIKNND